MFRAIVKEGYSWQAVHKAEREGGARKMEILNISMEILLPNLLL